VGETGDEKVVLVVEKIVVDAVVVVGVVAIAVLTAAEDVGVDAGSVAQELEEEEVEADR
jgi:hypothetical protein